MVKTTTTDWDLSDIGIEHSQYFQGFGCAFTSYANCAVGIGSDAMEALNDCLEQIAAEGIDTDDLEQQIMKQYPDFLDEKKIRASRVRGNSEDMYYHIGLRWN